MQVGSSVQQLIQQLIHSATHSATHFSNSLQQLVQLLRFLSDSGFSSTHVSQQPTHSATHSETQRLVRLVQRPTKQLTQRLQIAGRFLCRCANDCTRQAEDGDPEGHCPTVVHFNAEPELMDPSGEIFTVGIVLSKDENRVVHELPVDNVVRVTANWSRFAFQRKLDVQSASVNDVSAQLNTHPYSAYTALYRQNTVLHSSSREISSLEPPSHSMEISKEYFEGRQRVGSWPNRYR